jgi:hypothetical protein
MGGLLVHTLPRVSFNRRWEGAPAGRGANCRAPPSAPTPARARRWPRRSCRAPPPFNGCVARRRPCSARSPRSRWWSACSYVAARPASPSADLLCFARGHGGVAVIGPNMGGRGRSSSTRSAGPAISRCRRAPGRPLPGAAGRGCRTDRAAPAARAAWAGPARRGRAAPGAGGRLRGRRREPGDDHACRREAAGMSRRDLRGSRALRRSATGLIGEQALPSASADS